MEETKYTTIYISQANAKRLRQLKENPRETYDDVLIRVLQAFKSKK